MSIPIGLRQAMVTNVAFMMQKETMQVCDFEPSLGVTLRHVNGYDYASFMDLDVFDVAHDCYLYANNGYPTVFIGFGFRPQAVCIQGFPVDAYPNIDTYTYHS